MITIPHLNEAGPTPVMVIGDSDTVCDALRTVIALFLDSVPETFTSSDPEAMNDAIVRLSSESLIHHKIVAVSRTSKRLGPSMTRWFIREVCIKNIFQHRYLIILPKLTNGDNGNSSLMTHHTLDKIGFQCLFQPISIVKILKFLMEDDHA